VGQVLEWAGSVAAGRRHCGGSMRRPRHLRGGGAGGRYSLVGAQVLTTVLLNAVTPFLPLLLAALASCCLPLATRRIVTQVPAQQHTAAHGTAGWATSHPPHRHPGPLVSHVIPQECSRASGQFLPECRSRRIVTQVPPRRRRSRPSPRPRSARARSRPALPGPGWTRPGPTETLDLSLGPRLGWRARPARNPPHSPDPRGSAPQWARAQGGQRAELG
jgi:hypothetical protein